MPKIKFDQSIQNFAGFRVNAIHGDAAYEVLLDTKDARRLRTALMETARIAIDATLRRVVLVLEEPGITWPRLQAEWQGAASVIQPELLSRLSIAIHQAGKWSGIPLPPKPNDLPILDEILRHERSTQPAVSTRASEAHYEILRILIHEWLLGRGPIAIHSLMELSGNSHPTVSRSLGRLQRWLERHSDRSVELRIFPQEEWARLVAVSDEVRSTLRFVDRSGRPRSAGSLLRRLNQLNRRDIAMGGIPAAQHYQTSLDLVGSPRLDLSIHTGRKAADLSFVAELDPALEQTTRHDEAPSLVVHCIRRAASLFQPNDHGQCWADPVECLLDLHEARLESQALEFLNAFPRTHKRDEP